MCTFLCALYWIVDLQIHYALSHFISNDKFLLAFDWTYEPTQITNLYVLFGYRPHEPPKYHVTIDVSQFSVN